MVIIEETTLHITRGDETTGKLNRLAFFVPIFNGTEEEKYKFQPDDEITFTVVEKKGYTKMEIFQKKYTPRELGYIDETEILEIPLTKEETLKFPLKDKKATYWYEIAINDISTVLGSDPDGNKILNVYPNADE